MKSVPRNRLTPRARPQAAAHPGGLPAAPLAAELRRLAATAEHPAVRAWLEAMAGAPAVGGVVPDERRAETVDGQPPAGRAPAAR